MLQMWLERVIWDGLATWREKMRETGYQLAEIWLSQEMLERVDQGGGGRKSLKRKILKDDLKKGRLDTGQTNERARWRAQIMGKPPTCASTEKGT